ncbi:MAG: hypothetical protein IJX74_02130 [Clostridia bacterium]|nr:hypothetical protein [Clostridia bacterium]
MEQIKAFFESIWNLDTDQIAIISLLITLILFVAGKKSENRIKIYETRKEEYQKLIDFFLEIFAAANKNSSQIAQDDATKKRFLDMGASLAIYGSRKLYKTYCFYRWISLDEKVQTSKWYSKDMGMYCLGEMFQIMRKEIGLNREILKVDVPDILSFYITDFTKPEFKKNFYKYHFRKFLLKSAIFWGKVEDFIPLVWISNYIIKPIFLTLFCIVRFPIKLLIVTPIKQIKKVQVNKKK